MNFRFCHNNFNVLDLEKSIAFYEKALGLKEVKRKTADDGSFILVYLSDGETYHTLELTWLRDWDRPYNLGDNEDVYKRQVLYWYSFHINSLQD